MNFSKSTWAVVVLGIVAFLVVVIGVTRKILAKHRTDAASAQASATPGGSPTNDDSRDSEALPAFKDSQRKPRSEDQQDGIKRAHYSPPSRDERIGGAGSNSSQQKEPSPPPYVPMRLHSAHVADAKTVDHKADSTLANNDVSKTVVPAGEDKMSLAGFAPYGRLLKCELLLTLESTSTETPIVGLVTDDLYWNGKLIVPANSEVHGTAKIDRSRDRAFSDDRWIVVMAEDKKRIDGTELVLKAVALDREDAEGSGKTWGLTDGSYGLKGDVIKTDDLKTVEAFAAAAIAAGASSLQTTHQNLLGDSVSATPRNAALAGSAEVMRDLQKSITEEIQKNGSYLRVPAGKQFYLYIEESIFPAEAKIAGGSKSLTAIK